MENSSEFLRNLVSLVSQKEDEQLPIPSVAHLAFIPQLQRSNIIVMKSEPLFMQHMPTAFIGTIRPNYTNEMWHTDIAHWKAHFEAAGVNQDYEEIQLRPLQEKPEALDCTDAIPKTELMLKRINQLPANEGIRVIVLGTGHSSFLYDAISYLLREWRQPDGQPRMDKHMQFITSGDTKNRDMSDYCQWLCISGVCPNITFYNTMKYHPFGYCNFQYQGNK